MSKAASILVLLLFINIVVNAHTDSLRYAEQGSVFFTKNAGQWDARVLYGYLGERGVTALTERGVDIQYRVEHGVPIQLPMELSSSVHYNKYQTVSVVFINPSSEMVIAPGEQLGNVSHFYSGRDTSKWYKDVRNYGSILYSNVWDGIDVEYTKSGDRMSQNIIVHPGADMRDIVFDISDAAGTKQRVSMQDALFNNTRGIITYSGSRDVKAFASLKTGLYTSDTLYIFPFEFGTYLGGMDDEGIDCMDVDIAGNVYVFGITASTDYPLLNEFNTFIKSQVIGGSGLLSGLKPNGKELLFSTYINAMMSNRSIATANDGSIWLCAQSACSYSLTVPPYYVDNHFPLTSDAKRTTCTVTSPAFIQIDPNGKVLYASYFQPNDIEYEYTIMKLDKFGTAILGMELNPGTIDVGPYTASFLTPGTMRSNRSQRTGHDICVLKYNIKKDSVVFCTFIGEENNSFGSISSIAFDSAENIAISGALSSPFDDRSLLTLVNPISTDSTRGWFVLKMDSLGQKIIFSTWAPMPGENFIHDMVIDKDDNIHGVATSSNYGEPETYNPLPERFQLRRHSDVPPIVTSYYFRISSQGALLNLTTFLGDSSETTVSATHNIQVDDCGNIYIHGEHADRIPDIFSRYRTNNAPFIAIIDSAISNVVYTMSTSTDIMDPIMSGSSYQRKVAKIDRRGNIYTARQTRKQLPVSKDAIQTQKHGGSDGFIARLHIPLCNRTEKCSIIAPDTVRLFRVNGKIDYPDIRVNYELQNRGIFVLTAPSVELEVPKELHLVGSSQNPSIPQPSPVQVSDTARTEWTLRLDSSITHDTVYDLRTMCIYLLPPDSGSMVLCNKPIYIDIVDINQCNIACGIGHQDTIRVDAANHQAPNPFPVSVNLRNDGDEECEIAKLVLRTGMGMMLHTVPEGDTLRSPGVLQPGGDYTTSFTLQLERRSIQRNIAVECIGYDRYGYEKMRCSRELVVLPIQGLDCATACTDTIIYTPVVGIPALISAKMEITNIADTVQRGIEVAIDLTSAPHLGLKPGYPAIKTLYSLDINAISPLQWELATIATTSLNTYDTIRFSYFALTAPERRSCECIVVVKTILVDIQCTINAPAILTVQGYSYDPNPFDLDYSLENKGSAQLDVASVVMTLPADITTSDPLSVAVTPLSPNGKHDLQWNLKALTSAYERNVTITITAYDSENKPVAVCEHHLILPAITDMRCEAQSTAHIIYNKNDRRYEPNPVTASLVVYNHVDTVQTTVEAEIDLTNAPHLKLAAGETNPQSVASLAAKASHQFDWKLDVLPAETQVMETVTMRYRTASHPEWRECSWTYTIDEEAKTYSAACIADGVDSLWLNGTAETIIPNPFQVYYTITNTGTGMLTNCNGTIHLPNHLQLMTGESPTKYYGNIEPGTSVQQSWMVGAEPSVQSLGTQDITFSFTADNLTADVPCDHTVIIAQKAQIDLALSHKQLYFIAKKDAALPTAQQIMVYVGSPLSMPWTAQGYPSWLSVQPTNGNTQTVDIQPNTTAMNLGTYTGAVDFVSSAPNSPKSLSVVYDIVETVGIPEVPAINGITLYQNYPNPFSETTSISFNVESQMQVALSVYNTLGNLVSSQPIDAQPGMNTVTISSLQPGLYMYVLSTPNGTVSRRMVRR